MKRTSGTLLCCVATLLALGAVMVFSCLSARASTLDIGLEYSSSMRSGWPAA